MTIALREIDLANPVGQFLRTAFRLLGGLFLALMLIVFVLSRVFPGEEPDTQIIKAQQKWQELCETTDCSRFPVGYQTYAVGPEIYYFPQLETMRKSLSRVFSGVRDGRFVDMAEDGNHLRSFSPTDGLIISRCCQDLLTFLA